MQPIYQTQPIRINLSDLTYQTHPVWLNVPDSTYQAQPIRLNLADFRLNLPDSTYQAQPIRMLNLPGGSTYQPYHIRLNSTYQTQPFRLTISSTCKPRQWTLVFTKHVPENIQVGRCVVKVQACIGIGQVLGSLGCYVPELINVSHDTQHHSLY